MQLDPRTKRQLNIAAYQILIQQLMIERLLIERAVGSSSIEKQDQKAYQAIIDRLIDRIARIMPSSAEKLLKITAQVMGVRAYGVVRAESTTKLVVEEEWPDKNISWGVLEENLLNRLTTGRNRSELMPIPEKLGSRNLLLSRLDAQQDRSDWLRALVFIGRKRPPVKGASPGFLTWDFPITERLADFYREEEAGVGESSIVYQPLWQATSLRNSLIHYLGPRVMLEIGDGELIISGITLQKELGDLATQAMAEICTTLLAGWQISEQAPLKKDASLPTVRGMIDEFRIVVREFPVFGRRISVRQLPRGIGDEVILPLGWWWTVEPQDPIISREDAETTALREEQSKQPDVSDLTAHLVETVLWPDNPPKRVAYQVQVTSERGLSATYFINAHDGSIIARRQIIRCPPPLLAL